MTGGIPVEGVDHVVIAVRSLQAAARRYRSLGFRLSPEGRHPTLGSTNHTFVFHSGSYGELLAVERPGTFTAYYQAFAESNEGLAGLALRTPDAGSAHASLALAGFAPEPVLEFARPVELPQGMREARFSVIQLPLDRLAGGRVFLCRHHTPELVWLPDMLDHPNGVLGIQSITLLALEPQLAADGYARLVGRPAASEDDSVAVSLGGTRLEVMTPQTFLARYDRDPVAEAGQPRFGAITLQTADLDRAAAILTVHGIRFAQIDGTLQVASPDALGVRLILAPAA
jgi:catechol 2,3-dioxygenase-like lactoylglutathione lyase family enzyme